MTPFFHHKVIEMWHWDVIKMDKHECIGYRDNGNEHYYCPEPNCRYELHIFKDGTIRTVNAQRFVNHYGVIVPDGVDFKMGDVNAGRL